MRVAVLGAGLQGACVALELASAGVHVDLYDQDDRCVARASAQNEGKIHLGYVYAKDRSLRTARTMVAGGISFASLLRRWIGEAVDTIPVSTPFHYVVHTDSLLGPADVEAHFRAVHAIALEESRDHPVDYFGSDYRVPPQRMTAAACAALFDARSVVAAYTTPEIGIDTERLAELVRARLASDTMIRCVMRAQVHGVDHNGAGPVVRFELDGSHASEKYDHVVNTLWDGRLAIDATAGLQPQRPWLYRIKHYARLRSRPQAATLPSTTIVLGAFGDVASYGHDHYLSWYPAGMLGSSSALSPPAWPQTLAASEAIEMRRSIMAGLATVVSAVGDLTPDDIDSCEIKAGIIFAWGQTDIQDRASGLHERHDIGPVSHGRYHTIDTGKLTMAPLFGTMVADRIRQIG